MQKVLTRILCSQKTVREFVQVYMPGAPEGNTVMQSIKIRSESSAERQKLQISVGMFPFIKKIFQNTLKIFSNLCKNFPKITQGFLAISA